MEYLDPNNPLLRRLSIEAPGTYQHSLLTANLAEAAAISIGANGVFCRVATMYHDIGKVTNPQYFTENQQAGFNMHELLTPEESAQVIIEHVKTGESLARKHKLPKIFINVVSHGESILSTQVNQAFVANVVAVGWVLSSCVALHTDEDECPLLVVAA